MIFLSIGSAIFNKYIYTDVGHIQIHQTLLDKLVLEGKHVRQGKLRKPKETLGEECGGLDGGKCVESGTNSSIS